jgi:hypothetical protein
MASPNSKNTNNTKFRISAELKGRQREERKPGASGWAAVL